MTEECQKLLPLIHDWVEGTADEETAFIAQQHLRQCFSCQQVVREWESIAEEIRAAFLVTASHGEKSIWRLPKPEPLLSWRVLGISGLLTTSLMGATLLWQGTSLTDLLRLLVQWILGTAQWMIFPVQWVQRFWDIFSHWA